MSVLGTAFLKLLKIDTHLQVLHIFIDSFRNIHFSLCVVYLLPKCKMSRNTFPNNVETWISNYTAHGSPKNCLGWWKQNVLVLSIALPSRESWNTSYRFIWTLAVSDILISNWLKSAFKTSSMNWQVSLSPVGRNNKGKREANKQGYVTVLYYSRNRHSHITACYVIE